MQRVRLLRVPRSLALRAALVVGAGAGLLACGTARGPVKLTEPVEREGQWKSVLKEHTRRDQAYDWQILEADLRATLVTPRLRSAFIQDQRRFHGDMANEFAEDLLQLGDRPDEGMDAPVESRPTAEEQVLVYAALFVRETRYRDLGTSTTIWDVHLVRGDTRVKPIAYEPLRFSPALEELLPYVDRFDEIYLLRFPLVAQDGSPLMSPGDPPLRLEVRSALGDLAAEWTLLAAP